MGGAAYVGGVEFVRTSDLAELHVRSRITVRSADERRRQILVSRDVPEFVNPRRHCTATTKQADITAAMRYEYLSSYLCIFIPFGWRLGVVASVVRRINEVTVHWARLVLGWVTVFGRLYHHGV